MKSWQRRKRFKIISDMIKQKQKILVRNIFLLKLANISEHKEYSIGVEELKKGD